MTDGREPEPKPCCARLPDDGGWCLLADGHAGDHVGRPQLDEHAPIATLCLGTRTRR